MSDQTEELLREIAVKHGIAVGRDDPIMVLRTINDRLLADSTKAQQAQLDRYKEEMEALAHRWGEDARGKAERIVNSALAASKDAMEQLAQQGAESAALAVREALESASEKLQVHSRDIGRIAHLNLMAAGLVLISALLAVWAAAG